MRIEEGAALQRLRRNSLSQREGWGEGATLVETTASRRTVERRFDENEAKPPTPGAYSWIVADCTSPAATLISVRLTGALSPLPLHSTV